MRPHLLFLLALCLASLLDANVLRVEITSRNDVAAGKAFGTSDPYQRIFGRVYFSVSIKNPRNERIVDLKNAQNLKNSEVEFSSDFMAIRPKDSALCL